MFGSVFKPDEPDSEICTDSPSFSETMPDIQVSENTVFNKLKNLNKSKSVGSDEIHSRVSLSSFFCYFQAVGRK